MTKEIMDGLEQSEVQLPSDKQAGIRLGQPWLAPGRIDLWWREAGDQGWDIGIIVSGGNINVEGMAKLFSSTL